jgi:ligand-binding SRPBCC domain-containing protein
MKYIHEYEVEQKLPISLEMAWDFFSSPKNLSTITPPEMEFRILTENLKDEIHEGMEIDYKVRPLLRIPMKWKTRICKIEDKKTFTDIQLKGPYTIWEHTHHFQTCEDGILMRDYIRYKIPMGIIGHWMNSLFIRKKIKSIFDFRKETLEKLFQP